MRPVRILITGGSGTGKTTLARALAQRFGVPATDLDAIAFVDANWTMRDLQERLRMVVELAAQESWVVSGGHLGWTAALWDRAQLVVWLDVPLPIMLWRLTLRYFRERPRVVQPRLDRLVPSMWVWNVRWYLRPVRAGIDFTESRQATAAVVKRYAGKVLRIRGAPSVPQTVQVVAMAMDPWGASDQAR